MACDSLDTVSKYNFIAEPDDALVCVICLEVAEDPRQHERCGRLLCKGCLEKYGKDKPCPNCRGQRPQYFQDNRSEFLKLLLAVIMKSLSFLVRQSRNQVSPCQVHQGV